MNFKINTILPRKYKIPDIYQKIVSMGYLSIILLFLSLCLDLIVYSTYGNLNGNLGLLIKVLQVIGALLFVYSILVMGSKMKNIRSTKSTLRRHYNILFVIFIFYLGLNILLQHFKIL
jgi:hypothetical protein